MKKIILYMISFFLSSAVYAKVADFNGLYFGLGAGGIEAVSHNEAVLAANIGAGVASLALTKTLKEKETTLGFEGDLIAGYGQVVNQKYLLGIEGIVGLDRFKLKNTGALNAIAAGNPVAQVNVEPILKASDPFVALLFKPGFLISSNTLCYGLAGAKIGRFKVVSEGSHSQAGGGSSAASNNKTFTKVGVALGLGMETFLAEKMTVGLNYQGVYYGKFSDLNAFSLYEGADGTLNVVNKNKLYTNTLLIRFNCYV